MSTELELLKRGFNDGYILQKSKPELAVKIAKSFEEPNHPYANGFIIWFHTNDKRK